MKKDIEFPEVKDIHIVAVNEWNQEFEKNIWSAYLINQSSKAIESILIVSAAEGEINGEMRKSSLFRHAFPILAPQSHLKIELLDENIFQLDNIFMVTYFEDGKLHDKNYIFPANSIDNEKAVALNSPLGKGVFAL